MLPREEQPFNLGSLLAHRASQQPDAVAVIEPDGRTTTYRNLFRGSGRLARTLTAHGLVPGDRVAVWMQDGPEHIQVYLACARAGLVVVPINARYTVHEATVVVEDSEPRALVWHESKDAEARDLLDRDGDLVGVRLAPSGRQGPAALDWHLAAVAGASRFEDAATTGSDTLVIGYTSGTTGRPKGALLTHASVAAVMRQNAAAYRLPSRSVIAMTGSMSFVSVVPAHVLTHLALTGTVVFTGAWTVPSLLDVVERHQATFTYLPSPVLEEFTAEAARNPARWRSLTSILHSASKAPAHELHALADVVGARLVEGWGMTENSGGLMTATSASDVERRHAGPHLLDTVGRPLPGYDVRLEEDELVVRGPGVVQGYWRRPDASAAAFVDGWFRTGDVGEIDEQGYVTVLERRTDLIVSGGMNVYPAEVEAVISALPEVAEVAVVGAPHPRWGQTVVAMVVPSPRAQIDVQRIESQCRERLASYKKPTEVLVAADLPRTTSLKVSRAGVRSRVLAARSDKGCV